MSLSEPLNSEVFDTAPPKPAKASCPIWMSIGFVLIAIAISSTFVFIFTKNHYRPDDYYDPGVKYKQPDVYEVSLRFRAPFFDKDFAQPIVAHVDNLNKRMRLSYYNGANTYIYNGKKDTKDYLITPVYDRLGCFETLNTEPVGLPYIFPDLRHFEKESDKETVNGVECHAWHYSTLNTTKGKDYDSYIPDELGYSGNYTFYRDAKTGQPVALHTIGRNIFNEFSHLEEYWIDYLHVNKLTSLPQDLFDAPHGMPCTKQLDRPAVAFYSPLSQVSSMLSKTQQSPVDSDANQLGDGLGAVFEQWRQSYGKQYDSQEEYLQRKATFQKNILHIHDVNAQNLGYQLEVNHFADMTANEITLLSGGRRYKADLGDDDDDDDEKHACTQYTATGKDLPKSVDYRKNEKLKPYFDMSLASNHRHLTQIQCGSCWANALTRAIDTSHYLKYDFTPETPEYSSVQHLLDCTWSYGNQACNGGIDAYGASWLIQQNEGAIAEDTSYGHFLSQNGFCHYSLKDGLVSGNARVFTTVTACEQVGTQWTSFYEPVSDAETLIHDLKDALAFHGPLSVSIDVPADLYYYKSGIYNNPKCKQLPGELVHSVTAIGYDVDEKTGVEYVILENSWSPVYGEKGYIRMALTDNTCGVASAPLAVHVK